MVPFPPQLVLPRTLHGLSLDMRIDRAQSLAPQPAQAELASQLSASQRSESELMLRCERLEQQLAERPSPATPTVGLADALRSLQAAQQEVATLRETNASTQL